MVVGTDADADERKEAGWRHDQSKQRLSTRIRSSYRESGRGQMTESRQYVMFRSNRNGGQD